MIGGVATDGTERRLSASVVDSVGTNVLKRRAAPRRAPSQFVTVRPGEMFRLLAASALARTARPKPR